MHRDVKTENMLLDIYRTLKIADFGVARVEAQNPRDMTGNTGTLGYMAPEVCCFLLQSKIHLLLRLSLVHSFYSILLHYIIQPANQDNILEILGP